MLEKIKKIVIKAAEFVSSNLEIHTKGTDENIVTSADTAIQEFLKKELYKVCPSAGFMGEENNEDSRTAGLCWIVDPIDGTANFTRGMNQSAISVALCDNGIILTGVVFNPFLKEMFWAERGKGAYLNGKKIHVSDVPFKQGLFCTAMSLYAKQYANLCNDIIMDVYFKCNDVRRFGAAALELCYIAAGRCDLYFEYRLYPWDFAAASLILTEAGGFIGDKDGKAHTFEREDIVIAGNSRENFNFLVNIVKSHIERLQP